MRNSLVKLIYDNRTLENEVPAVVLQQHLEEGLQPWLACRALCHYAHISRTRSVPQSSPS